MAAGRIYHLVGSELVALDETPYDVEETLQALLADHPDLLAGDQIDPEVPRRWLLIGREAGIPDAPGGADRWSIDHLFVDQDGVPTLVEVKRSSDTRIRREVVGQMLDYAANLLAHWPAERIPEAYRLRFGGDDAKAGAALAVFLQLTTEPEGDDAGALEAAAAAFWASVTQNLIAKRLRLLFVADVIPRELQRIIEYLNENMAQSEVLGIEVRQYTGAGHTTLVPRVIGRTTAAEDVKAGARSRATRREWTLEEFLADCARGDRPDIADLARRLVRWMVERGLEPSLGHGAGGPMCVQVPGPDRRSISPVSLSTGGHVEVAFQVLRELPPFDQPAARHALQERLHAIPGVALSDDAVERGTWPSFDGAYLVARRIAPTTASDAPPETCWTVNAASPPTFCNAEIVSDPSPATSEMNPIIVFVRSTAFLNAIANSWRFASAQFARNKARAPTTRPYTHFGTTTTDLPHDLDRVPRADCPPATPFVYHALRTGPFTTLVVGESRPLLDHLRHDDAHAPQVTPGALDSRRGTLKIRVTTLAGWTCHTWSHPGGVRANARG